MAISRIGYATGVTSATLPAHQAGDLIVAFAFRDGSNTSPSLPAGWINVINGGANTCSYRLAYKIAAGASETATGFTSATSLICVVYRGVDQTTPLGTGSSPSGTVGTTISYNGFPLDVTDGSSWVVAFGGHRSTNTSLETPPSGMAPMTGVTDATDEAAAHDTNGGTASWAGDTYSIGGTSSGWWTIAREIRAASAPTNPVPRAMHHARMRRAA